MKRTTATKAVEEFFNETQKQDKENKMKNLKAILKTLQNLISLVSGAALIMFAVSDGRFQIGKYGFLLIGICVGVPALWKYLCEDWKKNKEA